MSYSPLPRSNQDPELESVHLGQLDPDPVQHVGRILTPTVWCPPTGYTNQNEQGGSVMSDLHQDASTLDNADFLELPLTSTRKRTFVLIKSTVFFSSPFYLKCVCALCRQVSMHVACVPPECTCTAVHVCVTFFMFEYACRCVSNNSFFSNKLEAA